MHGEYRRRNKVYIAGVIKKDVRSEIRDVLVFKVWTIFNFSEFHSFTCIFDFLCEFLWNMLGLLSGVTIQLDGIQCNVIILSILL